MILGIICFLVSCLGIYGFYNEIYVLTYIALVFSLFENIIGLINGDSKTLLPTFWAGVIGWIIIDNFWLGISIGICFENVIMFIGGCLMIFIGSIITSNFDNENDSNIKNDENTIEIMKQTIDNAKRDLEKGVKKEQLDKMLENGFITQEKYDETLDSLKTLEMLANFDLDQLKDSKSTKD